MSDWDKKYITKEISFGKFIDRIYRNNSYYIGKNLEKYNLNKSEYKYLIRVYCEEGLCQEDIVNLLKVDKYEVAKVVKSLIEKDYIYKIRDNEDKRKYRLYLTDKAKNIKEGFTDVLSDSSSILTKNFSEKEKEIVLDLLTRMANNIYEEVEKIKSNK